MVFLIIFTFGIFYTQYTKKDYTNSLASIESATQYQPINKMGLESSGQIVTNLTTINNNNEVLRKYLDKDVKNQFDNIGSTIGVLNNQITMLYTLLSNSLTIISIILGMFTLVIAVLGFYISKVIEERYNDVKQILKDTTLVKDDAEKYKKKITDALKKKGNELYEEFRKNHIASIIADLKENVENIELYHSELITNLGYLSFDDIEECLDVYYESGKMSSDPKISAKYLHILLLIDVKKCLESVRLLNKITSVYYSIPKLPLTYVQMREILRLFVHHDFTSDKIERVSSFVKHLIEKDDYSKLESCLTSIETESEKNQFIKELLNFDINIFDGYIEKWKLVYQTNEVSYKDELKNITLMEQIKLELTPEDKKLF